VIKRPEIDKEKTLRGLRNAPRASLGLFPTPIHELPRLSKYLGGPKIYVKRDDQTGLATGGNKTRKLEFLIGEAIAKKADLIMTAGAPQSNSCRQCAAAAALLGIDIILVMGGDKAYGANYFLDQLFGAQFEFTTRENRGIRLLELAEQKKAEGRNPYIIPVGGSNAVGSLGYLDAMLELDMQLSQQNLRMDNIIIPSSSGGTHAGIEFGARLIDYSGRTLGIAIDQKRGEKLTWQEEPVFIANKMAKFLDVNTSFVDDDFDTKYEYLEPGYGVVTPLEKEAIKLAAQKEGLLLDPVYTARAFGGLIDLIQKKEFDKDETVLFWHTGGNATLFAYEDELKPKS
jgi:D-cysteine desulfhydrase family pyridoxal phosphate-dependent enzyme